MVDLKEIQKMQEQFVSSRKWDRFDSCLVYVHLIEEMGEIGSYILYDKKYKIEGAGHKKNIDHDKLKQEFAQVFNLFLQLASQFDVDLEETWKIEHQANKKRFSKKVWENLAEESENSS